MQSLLIIDMLAEERGHLINDDYFLMSTLRKHFSNIRILSSPESITYIKKRLQDNDGDILSCHSKYSKYLPYRIRILMRVLLARVRNKREIVLLQSFEEIAAVMFMLINRSNRVFLKVTNNLGNAVNINWMRRLALKFAVTLAFGVLVHCEFEKRILCELFCIDPKKVHVIKFHQFGRYDIPRLELQRKKRISYIGGGRPGMGLDKFLELAERAPFLGYTYSLDSRVSEKIKRMKQPNLIINAKYLTEEEYFCRFYESEYIIMPYSKEYEGKTSGIFCDAVLTQTPVIAPKIEPFISFFSRYGALGYLINFDDKDWLNCIKELHLNVGYEAFQKNMRRLSLDHSWESIGLQISEIFYGGLKKH